jgi:hypothetical protein
VSNAFTVSAWTGSGSLMAPAGTGTVTANKGAGFTLANNTLSATDGMALGLSGITTANLNDTAGGGTFTLSGWTGTGTLKGSTETLVDAVWTGATLTNKSLDVMGGASVSLSGFTTANLTDQAGGNTFTVSNWTGTGSLTDAGPTPDTVTATKNASFTLTNYALSSTDGMSLGLTGITTANLSTTSPNKSFTVGGWTGTGTLAGYSTGQVTA